MEGAEGWAEEPGQGAVERGLRVAGRRAPVPHASSTLRTFLPLGESTCIQQSHSSSTEAGLRCHSLEVRTAVAGDTGAATAP